MDVNEHIIKYLSSGKAHERDVQSSADLSLHLNSVRNVNNDELYKINSAHSFINTVESSRICSNFDVANIEYIIFKGNVLAALLYENRKNRIAGDIDIYVREDDFDSALSILYSIGYYLRSPNALLGKHHVSLENNKVVVELHRNVINPGIGIDEDYLLSHVRKLKISGYEITTFDTTATFLHLLFHLYMDSCLTYNNLYSILTNREFPRTNRFLYRAYEIALYSEKYFENINWDEILKDLRCQRLRIIFKKMILDIVEIFPDVFPKSVLNTILQLNYIDDERDQLYKYLIDSGIKKCGKDIDYILINYINDNWEARREKNIYRKVSETFLLIKESLDGTKQDLNCGIDTERITDGLKIIFKVSNDDFCISETDNYDTQASDGVHLLLCGTEKYSYNSIFFFPKQIDGEIRVVVCDVLNNRNQILTDDLIKAEFSKTERDYTITAILSNEFLKENNLNSYLYMGLVISDCSSETHRRKNQLILSEDDSQWYNPVYFAKIIM